MGEMEEFKFCYHGPGDPIQEFWRFYEAKLGLAPKTQIFPHDLFYKYVNLKKSRYREVFVSKLKIELNNHNFSHT
jgi:hypothetical protein